MICYKNISLLIVLICAADSLADFYEYRKNKELQNIIRKHSKNKDFIDIYTNHPDEKEVVQNYFESNWGDENRRNYSPKKIYVRLNTSVVPKSESEDQFFYDHNGNKYGQKHSQTDELYPDFGVFENSNEENLNQLSQEEFLAMLNHKYSLRNEKQNSTHKPQYFPSFIVRKRPKFKTKNPLNSDNGEKSKDEVYIQEFNDVLKKHLVSIQKHNKVSEEKLFRPLEIPDQIPESTELDYQDPNSPPDGYIEGGQVVDQNSKFLDYPFKTLKRKTVKLANKFLSLFTIIQFPNSRCQASDTSSDYDGICFHRTECFRRNGTAMGFCANGYGVCCVDRGTCGGVSNRNCTYFESPSYPNYFPMNGSIIIPSSTTTTPRPGLTPDPRIKMYEYARQEDISLSLSCTYRVLKATPMVRQMRIDFLDLELRGPTNGSCVLERLIISGQNVNTQVPVICGYNSGQHVYVDVTNLIGPLQISILATTIERKRHRIRICQYEDSCEASMGCLQYFTGVQGIITSFNYEQSATFSRSSPGYFNSLNYAICIRREAGYCSITYRNVDNNIEYPFQMVNFLANGVATVPDGQAGVEIFNCPTDYIVINGIRLCGYKFNDGSLVDNFRQNAAVTDTSSGPIIIPVRSDSMNATGQGFKLFYTQNRCT